MHHDSSASFPKLQTVPYINGSTVPHVDPSESRVVLFTFHGNISIALREGEEVVIGRKHSSTSSLNLIDLTNYGAIDSGVSRAHVKLKRKDNQWWVEDLGSSNGTWLNNKRIAPHNLYVLNSNSDLTIANMSIGVFIADDYKGKPMVA